MPTPKKGPRLGGSPSHQRHILSNLATQLIENGQIRTTEAKARALQPVIEKLITKGKRGDLHARRTVAKTIRSREAVYQLFDVVVPQIDAERQGGYTRITKIGNRKGDNASMVIIEIITEPVVKKAVVKDATKTAKKAAEKAAKKPVEDESSVEETVEVSPTEEVVEGEVPAEVEADENAEAAEEK